MIVANHNKPPSHPQISVCCKLILNSCLSRKPVRITFYKISVFRSRHFCISLLNLFSLPYPLCTFNHLLCLLFQCVRFQLLEVCLVTAGKKNWFFQSTVGIKSSASLVILPVLAKIHLAYEHVLAQQITLENLRTSSGKESVNTTTKHVRLLQHLYFSNSMHRASPAELIKSSVCLPVWLTAFKVTKK